MWNLWHGCHKISAGCKNCYVYRQDSQFEKDSTMIYKTKNFDLPIKRKKNGEYKLLSNEIVHTCFTSDFFVEDADDWRHDAFKIMKQRSDLKFFIITKRIDRFMDCIPYDWNDGYDNVLVACTVENQEMADYRLPFYLEAPIKHKAIMCAPLLGKINLIPYLNDSIELLSVGGESGINVRVCDYDYVLDIRNQCIQKTINFEFHQTGAYLKKDNKVYRILRKFQHSQAKKANINLYFKPMFLGSS